MANNSLLVNERQNDLGNFTVGRLLPFRKKRQVGPFTFIDHMGPSTIGPGKYLDVDQHPHIGLSALTYLFEGEIEHRDSIGSIQTIRPGDVGFMTAGNGVTHTERTPEVRRTGDNFTMSRERLLAVQLHFRAFRHYSWLTFTLKKPRCFPSAASCAEK